MGQCASTAIGVTVIPFRARPSELQDLVHHIRRTLGETHRAISNLQL